VVNLTAHKDEHKSWKLNVQDSILFNNVIGTVLSQFKEMPKVIDLGSGGGSPAIPIKISFPHIDMTMVDSVGKKVTFLNEVAGELGLYNCRAVHDRIEDFCRTNRESFDVVTARAVAPLNVLLEYALPLLKVGGCLLAFKGSSVHEEIVLANNALEKLGGWVEKVENANLDDETTRHLVMITKTKKTPMEYPRGRNLPRLKPL